MNLNEIAAEIHAENKLKGFDVSYEPFPQPVMMVVTELSEAVSAHQMGKRASVGWIEEAHPENTGCEPEFCEAFRNQVKDTVDDELADAFIRLMDLTAAMGIDIDKHVRLKRRYNASRPWKHGKLY